MPAWLLTTTGAITILVIGSMITLILYFLEMKIQQVDVFEDRFVTLNYISASLSLTLFVVLLSLTYHTVTNNPDYIIFILVQMLFALCELFFSLPMLFARVRSIYDRAKRVVFTKTLSRTTSILYVYARVRIALMLVLVVRLILILGVR